MITILNLKQECYNLYFIEFFMILYSYWYEFNLYIFRVFGKKHHMRIRFQFMNIILQSRPSHYYPHPQRLFFCSKGIKDKGGGVRMMMWQPKCSFYIHLLGSKNELWINMFMSYSIWGFHIYRNCNCHRLNSTHVNGMMSQWQYVSNGKCVVVPTILIILTQYLHSWHNVNLNDEISKPNLIRGGGGGGRW